jgi:hypothetical protein
LRGWIEADMAFAKGRQKIGGRQKGVVNAVTVEIKAMARSLVTDPAYVRALRKRLLAGDAGPVEPILYYYAFGRPKYEVAVDQPPQGVMFARVLQVMSKEQRAVFMSAYLVATKQAAQQEPS